MLAACDPGVADPVDASEPPADAAATPDDPLDAAAAPDVARPPDALVGDARVDPDAAPADAGVCAPACAPNTCADDGCGGPCACPDGATCRAGRCGLAVTNPVLAGDHPDPDVLRVDGPDGPTYYLSHTVHDAGDLPLYRSRDLVSWERLPAGAFARPRTPGASMAINDAAFCALWAPDLAAIPGGYLLGVTAMRYRGPQAACPGYGEDGGVYQAWSPTPEGPYGRPDHPWEPVPAGANAATCALRDQLPRSVDYVSHDCQGTFCHHIIRLDSETWQDPATGRWWMSYAWFTNVPPRVAWEREHLGEHVSLVELDPADPFAVRCAADTPQIFVADGHDAGLRAALAAACPRCGEQLAFDRGRQGERLTHAGLPWTVVEGPALLRRGDYVYAFLSGSAWDSAWYHVFWIAARTVEGLAQDAPDRLVGRLLIPSQGQAFGHGVPVLGPDGEQWFYVHHRLDAARCRDRGDCRRDLWITPIDFMDRGDGRGAVHVAPRTPAEAPDVFIPL